MRNVLTSTFHDEFACTQCGKCCRVGGQIIITRLELERIAAYLEIEPVISDRLPFKVNPHESGGFSLLVTTPCFFMDKATNECMIHPVKPSMCRDYPWRAFAGGLCNLDDVLVCPVAHKQLSEVLRK